MEEKNRERREGCGEVKGEDRGAESKRERNRYDQFLVYCLRAC